MISVLLTHKLQSFMEITRETRIVCGLCCVRAAHWRMCSRNLEGPSVGLELYYFMGSDSIPSPRLFF